MLLFGETTTIFILYKSGSISHLLYTWKLFFIFSLYKYIAWLEMSTRKYAFGYEKPKKRKKEEKLIESKKWSIDKFVISNKQNITQNLDESIKNEQEFEYKKYRLKRRC